MSRQLLAVGCGGAFGALARYGIATVLDGLGAASWAPTLVVNLLGSALIGWGFIVIQRGLRDSGLPGPGAHLLGRIPPSTGGTNSDLHGEDAKAVARRWNTRSAFWQTGVLGGFTTFSTFSLDVVTHLQAGDLATAVVLVALSVVGCALGTTAGVLLAGGRLNSAGTPCT